MYAVDRAISAGSSELATARHEQTLEVNLVLRDFTLRCQLGARARQNFLSEPHCLILVNLCFASIKPYTETPAEKVQMFRNR